MTHRTCTAAIKAVLPPHKLYCHAVPQAGLAGLAFDEGTFGVFGYVTKVLDSILIINEK